MLLAFAMGISLCGCLSTVKAADKYIGDNISVTVEDQYEGDADVFASVSFTINSFDNVSLPYYNEDVEHEEAIDIWYINGNPQVPYISLDGMIQILSDTNDVYNGYSLTKSKHDEEWNILNMTRDNGSVLEIDFDKNLLTFNDIDTFVAPPDGANGLDIIDITTNGADNNTLIEHSSAFYKNPDTIAAYLGDYGIPMIYQNEDGYLPLQTIADILVSRYSMIFAYNGQAVLLAKDLDTTPAEEASQDSTEAENTESPAETSTFGTNTDADNDSTGSEPTLGGIYFSAPSASKSEMLKVFNYNELCLALDCSYGLKAEHEISSCNDLFIRTGLCDYLMSDNL